MTATGGAIGSWRRLWGADGLAIVLGVVWSTVLLGGQLAAVIRGGLGTVRGDASARLLVASHCATDIVTCATETLWAQHWPVGHFVLLAPLVAAGEAVGMDMAEVGVTSALLGTLAAVLLAGVIGYRQAGPIAATAAPLALLSLTLVARHSFNTYAEGVTLPVVLLATLLAARGIERGRGDWVTGLVWGAGATLRTDVAGLGVVAGLVVWHAAGWRAAARVAAPSIVIALLQLAVSSIAAPISYVNVRTTYRQFPSGTEAVGDLVDAVPLLFGQWQVVLWVLAVVGCLAVRRRPGGQLLIALLGASLVPVLVLPVLGMAQASARYFHAASGLVGVLAGIGVAHVVARFGQRLRPVVAAVVLLMVGVVGVIAHATVRDEYRATYGGDVSEVATWLEQHTTHEDVVYLDYVRFMGAWFRVAVSEVVPVAHSYDYTAYYHAVPPVRRPSWDRLVTPPDAPVRERLHERISRTGRDWFARSQPTIVVVATPAFGEHLERTAPGLQSIRPYLVEAGGVLAVDAPDIPGTPLYKQAAVIGRFRVLTLCEHCTGRPAVRASTSVTIRMIADAGPHGTARAISRSAFTRPHDAYGPSSARSPAPI